MLKELYIENLAVIEKADIGKIAVDGMNGAGLMEDALKERKLKKAVIMKTPQVIKANALFEQALSDAGIVHMQQSAAEQVITNCEKRAIGSNGGFGYRSLIDGADISILDSMIIAHWICTETKAGRKQNVSY